MPVCRSCGAVLGKPFLSLGNMPLSNSYLTEEDLHRAEITYPLETYACERCFLVQIEEFERAEDIFSEEYAYFSSYSESWLAHCARYTEMMVSRFDLKGDSFVVEVASNDGYLLQYFKERGIPVLGVEPAGGTARSAIEKGIPTDVTFFDTAYGEKMPRKADLLIGNNVLAHNPNLNDFVKGLKLALSPAGVITMEFPHLLQLIEGVQFDTIYHEHFSYFSLLSVEQVFTRAGLSIFDVEELPTHGGSLRIYGKHDSDATKTVSPGVDLLREKEISAGFLSSGYYESFGEKVKEVKRRLISLLAEIKDAGKTVAGYGAPAKGNTLLNYCGIRGDFIDYTVDRNPHKQGLFLPGTHIPIASPELVRETQPDYLLILPWNLKEEIMGQMAHIREWGGKFIVPIPRVEVIP